MPPNCGLRGETRLYQTRGLSDFMEDYGLDSSRWTRLETRTKEIPSYASVRALKPRRVQRTFICHVDEHMR